MNYIFNPCYKLKNDLDRIILINNYEFSSDYVLRFLHPIHAVLLCFFDGKHNLTDIYQKVESFFGIDRQDAIRLITPLIENKKDVYIKYDNNIFSFPRNVLVRNEGNMTRNDLLIEDFVIKEKMDFKRRRLSSPLNLLICINLKCVTDCIYCYADRKKQYKALTSDKWVQIIYEAKKIGIQHIDITGGEFFLTVGWEKIVAALSKCGYSPEISTKIPLSNETIDKFAESGLTSLQFSLDTLNQELATITLNVNNEYVEKILKSIKYSDSKGINVILKPTLSRFTCSIDNVKQILDFADTLTHVKRCVFSIIGYSCYKSVDNYNDIKPSADQINDVEKFIVDNVKFHPFQLYNDNQIYLEEDLRNFSIFKKRGLCTANVDGFMILPNGKVTLCEELYWNPDFILGDLNDMSIQDVWNSQNAIKLWDLKQENMPKNSACSSCQDFYECRLGKGVCWKLILAGYGRENLFFPDPRCPRAPEPKYRFVGD